MMIMKMSVIRKNTMGGDTDERDNLEGVCSSCSLASSAHHQY